MCGDGKEEVVAAGSMASTSFGVEAERVGGGRCGVAGEKEAE